MSMPTLNTSFEGMEIAETPIPLIELNIEKARIVKKIKELGLTTFEIYGSVYFMNEFPRRYAELAENSKIPIEGVRHQFYRHFKELDRISQKVFQLFERLDSVNSRIANFSPEQAKTPYSPEDAIVLQKILTHIYTSQSNVASFFDISAISPRRGTNIGIKRRSPTPFDDGRVVRAKTHHQQTTKFPIADDSEDSKTAMYD